MKRIWLFLIFLLIVIFSPALVQAEDKPAGRPIPKLPASETVDGPQLINNYVYPMWGPTCQEYIYTVTYQDPDGRPPAYVQIYFNGQMIDMDKSDPEANDYSKGVKYEYKFVPTKIDSNFYYFEASNGAGKTRASIIDSPDNGPVLFDTDFLDNEIAVINTQTGDKLISYPTQDEWIGGVAMSANGQYTAVKTSRHIYLFDLNRPDKPVWSYQHPVGSQIGGDLKGGVDISDNGETIIASTANSVLLFNSTSNQPVWQYRLESSAYNVAISANGQYAAAATGGEATNPNSNLLILWQTDEKEPLWKYHASGNFHDVSLSADGQYVTGSTGCPDRRFYLFTKDNNQPLIRTDMLTGDSPVHRAKISADGQRAAVGSESGFGAVFMFSADSSQPVWKFPTAQNSSVRALSLTPDGQYIGASTLKGQAYIFSGSSAEPVTSWQINAALGGIDIADDGSFIVTGGSDKKLHILSQDKSINLEIPFEEYIEEIDIAANGQYVAAGTGGSVYFFETIPGVSGKTTPCTTIIKPQPMEQGAGNLDEQIKNSDVDLFGESQTANKLPGMMSGFGFLGVSLLLIVYLAIVKFNLLKKESGFWTRIEAKLILVLIIFMGIFLGLTVWAMISNSQQLTPTESTDLGPADGSGCGNHLCEPNLGESRQNCPQDCTPAN